MNHTYEIKLKLSNVAQYDLDEIIKFIKFLEDNGTNVEKFNVEND